LNEITIAGQVASRAFSSAKGSIASLSALLSLERECSRRKNTRKVKTKHRLIVRVKGMTDILRNYFIWLVPRGFGDGLAKELEPLFTQPSLKRDGGIGMILLKGAMKAGVANFG
jgi:hypothetical protein